MGRRFACHRSNLFSPDLLFSANCLSVCEKQSKLAVLRRSLPREDAFVGGDEATLVSNSFIEIWQFDLDINLFLSQVIYEDEDEPCLLEALEWSNHGQLFACGLDARLHQVDLAKGSLKKWFPLVSGPAWCMKFNRNKDLVAVGTEEGYICVFKVSPDETVYEKNLNRDAARVLSLVWHEPSDDKKTVLSGSIGTIKIWDYESGSCLTAIKLDTKSSVSVWCLEILDPFIIVSGDSRGHTSFWDGSKGTWINSIDAHGADVLCLALSKQKNSRCVYSSGVDPLVVKFETDSAGRGIQCSKLYHHFHDVRSMIVHNNYLVSSGYDCFISRIPLSSKTNVRQIPSFYDHVHIHQDRFLFQYHKHLELWKTGSLDNDQNISGNHGDQLSMRKVPVKLADIRTKKMIHRSNFSGSWIIYSVYDDLKVLLFKETEIAKIPLLFDPFTDAINHIEFINDSHALIVSGTDIFVLKLDPSGVKKVRNVHCKRGIHRICSSEETVAISYDDLSFEIVNAKDWSSLANFKLNKLPVFLKFNSYQPTDIYIGFPTKISIYDFNKKAFSSIRPHEVNPYLPLQGITFCQSGLIVYNQDHLYHFDGELWVSSQTYSLIVKSEFIPDRNELIVMELTEDMFMKQLPSALKKKKFGT